MSYIDKMNYIRGESQKKQVAVVVHKGQDLTSLGEMGLGSLPPLTVAKGDTAILLSAMPMLKYCEQPLLDYNCIYAPAGVKQ